VLFDTPVYFVFLALVVAIYWRLPWKKQNWLLLGASYIFYGWWDWRFLGLMIASTSLDYCIAFLIAGATDITRRKRFLILSITLNLTFLGFFKYFDFFVDSFLSAAASMGIHNLSAPLIRVLLPPASRFILFRKLRTSLTSIAEDKSHPAPSPNMRCL
jgi:alginate O-acetyltransferase complex protein AlgI